MSEEKEEPYLCSHMKPEDGAAGFVMLAFIHVKKKAQLYLCSECTVKFASLVTQSAKGDAR